MHVKSKEKDIYEKFYDWFKEIFDIEDDEEEIEKVIIYTNKKKYMNYNLKIMIVKK